MKKLTLLFTITAFVAGNLFATTRTVSNHPNGGAQYATLAAAYAASSNGDTLLLEGTDVPYVFTDSSNPWAKQLTVIGIGFNPTKSNPRKAIIRGSQVSQYVHTFYINNLGDASNFYGVQFEYSITTLTNVSHYSFYDCLIHSVNFDTFGSSDIIFVNCVINSGLWGAIDWSGGTVSNTLFLSCIVEGSIRNSSPTFSNARIEHCVFSGLSGGIPNALYGIDNSTIQNNIFSLQLAGPVPISNIHNSIVNNNIYNNSTSWPVGNGNTSNNNLSNTDPLFVNCPVNSDYFSTNDYHLQAGSPAIGAGINGSDIGPHGSASNFSETGEVLIAPIVRSLSTSVGAGNTLNINVNATKPNDN